MAYPLHLLVGRVFPSYNSSKPPSNDELLPLTLFHDLDAANFNPLNQLVENEWCEF